MCAARKVVPARWTVPGRSSLPLILAVFVALVAPAAFADDHPSASRGFQADQVYQVGDVDSVNLFNGNLTIAIPIGPRLHVGGNVDLGLNLVYNSSVWEVKEDKDGYVKAHHSRDSNAGIGWYLGLGVLRAPARYLEQDQDYSYLSPDGSEHVFYSKLHVSDSSSDSNVWYTRDGSYLRMRIFPTATPVYATVEHPSGLRQEFEKSCVDVGGITVCHWDLRKVYDQHFDNSGNPLNFINVSQPEGCSCTRLEDSFQRKVEILRDQDWDVSSVVFYDANNTPSTAANYLFTYDTATIPVSCKEDTIGSPPHQRTVHVKLLTGLTLPDGSSWEFGPYNEAADPDCNPEDLSGTIQSLRYPTGGTISWQYATFDVPGGYQFGDPTGVSTRSVTDPTGASATGTWTYTRPVVGSSDRNVTTTVTSPAGDETVHFFRGTHARSTSDWSGWDWGLPFTNDPSLASGGLFLSSREYDGTAASGILKRSNYVKYERDVIPSDSSLPEQDWYNVNRRVVANRTVYEDDASTCQEGGLTVPCATNATFTGFDGLGNYRTVTSSHNFPSYNLPSGSSRSTFTGFNPDGTTYRVYTVTGNSQTGNYLKYPVALPWVLGTYDASRVTEESVTYRKSYCFDKTTGFLRATRIKTGVTDATSDLLTVNTPDPSGNVITVQDFGGDRTPIPSPLAYCQLPWVVLDGHEYRTDYAHAFGARQTAKVNATGITHYALDLDIQGEPLVGQTGWLLKGQVRAAHENSGGSKGEASYMAGLATGFQYDTMGRVVLEEPDQGASTRYAYVPYSVSDADSPRVELTRFVTVDETETILAQKKYLYDGFGRLREERTLLADNTWNQRQTRFNAMGWVTKVSELQPLGATLKWTESSEFDPFGRARYMDPPDGTAHRITTTYTGVRKTERTVKIRTAFTPTAEADSVTTSSFDGFGRLYSVTEPSGSNGDPVTTTYAYDPAGRLKTAKTTYGTTTQTRSWSYSTRGFLLTETMPEKGTSGNGSVTYSSYDSHGKPWQIVDGPSTLGFTYDKAGRITQVQEKSVTPNRTLKGFSYEETSNPTGEIALGKLRSATMNNYYDGSANLAVTEAYTYAGLGGRVSQRATTVGSEVFTQSFTWDKLGSLAQETYPAKAGVAPERKQSYFYTNGFLTGIPGFADTITYHPNGLVNTVTHSSGSTWTTTLAVDAMARPSSIYTAGVLDPACDPVYQTCGTNDWNSGTYTYDGAGNVTLSWATYDKVSRLLTIAPRGWTLNGSQYMQRYSYDAFGNLTKVEKLRCTSSPCTNLATQTILSTRTMDINAATNRLNASPGAGKEGGTYDAAGNMTQWVWTGESGSKPTYEYDALNQVRRRKAGTTLKAEYAYTVDGERAREYDVASDTYTYTIRGLDKQVRRLFTNAPGIGGARAWSFKDHIRRDGQMLASYSPTEGVRHYDLDHLGTVRYVTNRCKQEVAWHAYYGYGEEAEPFDTTDKERVRFTGHERDLQGTTATLDDLDYMHGRYYLPGLGRFAGVDAGRPTALADPQGWNRYAYCQGNALSAVDPDGMNKVKFWVMTVRNVWREVERKVAVRFLKKRGDHIVRAEGPGASRAIKGMEKEAFPGEELLRHDKKPGSPDAYEDHWQPKKGPGGQGNYSLVKALVGLIPYIGWAADADATGRDPVEDVLAKASQEQVDSIAQSMFGKPFAELTTFDEFAAVVSALAQQAEEQNQDEKGIGGGAKSSENDGR